MPHGGAHAPVSAGEANVALAAIKQDFTALTKGAQKPGLWGESHAEGRDQMLSLSTFTSGHKVQATLLVASFFPLSLVTCMGPGGLLSLTCAAEPGADFISVVQ